MQHLDADEGVLLRIVRSAAAMSGRRSSKAEGTLTGSFGMAPMSGRRAM